MEFQVSSTDRLELIDVTDTVNDAVPADVDEGVCTVFVPHTTAAVVVNENESRLLSDIRTALGRLVPPDGDYAHDEIDDNADAHIRASLLGEHVTIPVDDGGLALGTWQSVLFVECDGPRTRRVSVTVLGE